MSNINAMSIPSFMNSQPDTLEQVAAADLDAEAKEIESWEESENEPASPRLAMAYA